MPSMRERIRIDDDGVRRLLESSGTVQVASHGPHGWPHLVPMWFSLDEDGLVTFTTYATSQKARNLQRDARVTVLVESGDVYDELRGVMIEGEAELIIGDPRQTALAMATSAARRAGRPRPTLDDLPDPLPGVAHKRCVVRIHPLRYRSWDHSKLSG